MLFGVETDVVRYWNGCCVELRCICDDPELSYDHNRVMISSYIAGC